MIDKKTVIVFIILLIIWSMFFWYLVNYGNQVRKDPCSVCSERVGKDVICNFNSGYSESIIFHPNGSIEK